MAFLLKHFIENEVGRGVRSLEISAIPVVVKKNIPVLDFVNVLYA